MSTITGHRYITADAEILNGEPVVKGTRTPVRAIVELYRLGVSAEEIPSHLPHLSLAQIFDALSFYSDNSDLINRLIVENKVQTESELALNE